jgi:hypothetical protein
MTIGLEPQHGALNGIITRLHLARTGFKSWSGKNSLTTAQNPNFPLFSAQERLRNGRETAIRTAEQRSSARLVLLLVVMDDRGKFHLHRARHRGGWAELVWWCPQGCGPRWSQNIVATLRTQISKLTFRSVAPSSTTSWRSAVRRAVAQKLQPGFWKFTIQAHTNFCAEPDVTWSWHPPPDLGTRNAVTVAMFGFRRWVLSQIV